MKQLHHQTGQGLAELAIVGTLVLVPLFLSLPLLTKFLEARHKNLQASRYAAWERTVWLEQAPMDTHHAISKPDTQINSELESRIFSRADTRIQSDEPRNTQIKPDWMLQVKSPRERQAGALFKAPQSQSTAHLLALGSANTSHRVSRFIREGLRPLQATGFAPNRNGMVKASVTSSLRPITWNYSFDPQTNGHSHYTLESELYLLTDGWMAESPEQMARSTGHLLPGEHLEQLLDLSEQTRSLSETVGSTLPWLEPIGHLQLGYIETETVPEQRRISLP